MKPINILGLKFNRLSVIKFLETRGNSSHAYWLCKCDCGNEIEVRASHLKTGTVKSCGCYASEVSSKRLKEYASSDAHKGKGNPAWRGDKASHGAIHTWLNKNGDKKLCEHCKSKKNLDFALIRGKKHSHNLSKYLVLCRSCHIKYDNK